MQKNAVIKGASYILAQTPDMVIQNGTTQTTERVVNPESEYLVELPKHLRTYDDCLSYIPNQVYIGNLTNDDLRNVEFPYYDKKAEKAERFGKYGEIMPQDEFYGLMQICDVFDLVKLEKDFAQKVKEKLTKHGMLTEAQINILDKNEDDLSVIEKLVNEEHAEGLYEDFKLVGCIKRAHDVDVNLSAHTMLENIAAKASSVLSLLHLVKVSGINKEDVDYVIDCCEEACGDMNQRGGGNFAKACAEVAGLTNATGSDVRGFCAGPSHAVLDAASLVKAGTFKNVIVTAGGCTAKLGMNGKDHVKKGLPVLEDCLGGFSVLISEDDFKSPVIRNDIVGRHTVGTGSAPQNVISALVTDSLDNAGLKVTDIDKFAPELQNPDITTPAGAGNVPEANYKMIAALAVKRGDIERTGINDFVKEHGLIGWAPTQGHIPSGVPYIGPLRDDILSGKVTRGMIIGKGSLFLGRMTNLFDGVSFVVEKNPGKKENDGAVLATKKPLIGVAVSGTEHGMDNIENAVKLAQAKGYRAVIIDGEDAHKKMDQMLANGEIQGAVTMHYPFPIGVSTVGRVVTPSCGKEMFLANTTGTSSTDRVSGMVLNTISGIITAKACGYENPTIGIANIEGAKQTEKALNKLKENGYNVNFTESSRADGGVSMRGNDLLQGTSDIMVMDALTGNLMMKIFSSYTTGGSFESLGYGYGPGIGEGFNKVIMIVSRASGAPVIANAIEFATTLIENDVLKIAKEEYQKANRAGLKDILAELSKPKENTQKEEEVKCPEKEVVTFGILGVEVIDLDDAAKELWKNNIYAETGMGCTGPVILVSEANAERAKEILKNAEYIA